MRRGGHKRLSVGQTLGFKSLGEPPVVDSIEMRHRIAAGGIFIYVTILAVPIEYYLLEIVEYPRWLAVAFDWQYGLAIALLVVVVSRWYRLRKTVRLRVEKYRGCVCTVCGFPREAAASRCPECGSALDAAAAAETWRRCRLGPRF